MGRAGGLAWFGFGEDKASKDFRGKERILAQYALHVQCSFRVLYSDQVILENLDMFEPNSALARSENFRWEKPGETLYDEKVETILTSSTQNGIVTALQVSSQSDLSIRLSSGYVIEIFNNLSANEEVWRFFEPGTEKPHLVVTGQGAQEE